MRTANLARYAATFGIGSLAGIANELLHNPNHWCLKKTEWKKTLLTCSVGNMYGWAAVAAVLLFDRMDKKVPQWFQILAVTVCAIAVEAAGSKISLLFHDGKQTWRYPDSWITAFNGSISLVSSAYFGLAVIVFYFVIYVPLLK